MVIISPTPASAEFFCRINVHVCSVVLRESTERRAKQEVEDVLKGKKDEFPHFMTKAAVPKKKKYNIKNMYYLMGFVVA